MTRDRQGRLVSCEHAARRVTREEPDGSVTVVADHYRGLALNRPNDVVVRSDGSIWFTDPLTFAVDTDLDFAGVYRVSPDLSRINLRQCPGRVEVDVGDGRPAGADDAEERCERPDVEQRAR